MAALSDWPWRHWAGVQPHRTAIFTAQENLSWSQLARRVDRLAAGLRQQGVGVGCCVALKAHNSLPALLAYLSLLQCGARLLLLNPQLPIPLLATLLPPLNGTFSLVLDGDPLPLLPALTLTPASAGEHLDWDPQQIATLTLTSGSTGQPKAAAHTFAAHLASATGVVTAMDFSADDCWLLSLPLFHVSGQGILWRWLLRGAGLALPGERPLHQALNDCTFASLVPTQLWRLLQHGSLPVSLGSVLLGGASIPQRLTAQAEASGLACWCGYGMTETASTVAAMRAGGQNCVGQALMGHQIRLVAGEVQIRSAALACGYWREGKLLTLTDAQGWFATRDAGRMHQGALLVTGRLDNQFFSGGEGIQPEQIESVLLAHPEVISAYVVPLQDDEFGHRPVAVVSLRTALPLATLAEWAKPRLAGFQQPVRWYLLPELNAGGIKISRQGLQQWVVGQEKGRR